MTDEMAQTRGAMDRRRVLQVGAAGAVVAGTVASGAPSLLGLASSPGYAAAASGTQTTPPPTPPPTTGLVAVIITLWDLGTNGPYSSGGGTGGATYLDTSPGNVNVGAPQTPAAANDTVQFAYLLVPPGNYQIHMDQVLAGQNFLGSYVASSWNTGPNNSGSPVALGSFVPTFSVTAGNTTNVNVTLVVNAP